MSDTCPDCGEPIAETLREQNATVEVAGRIALAVAWVGMWECERCGFTGLSPDNIDHLATSVAKVRKDLAYSVLLEELGLLR